jgi:ClpP class serine protease
MFELFQYRAWALSEIYYAELYPVVMKALNLNHDLVKKKSLAEFDARIELLLSHADPESAQPLSAVDVKLERDTATGMLTTKANGKTIALIPVVGPLTKNSDLCTVGMQTYQSLLNRANASSSIDGTVFIMDTPGGTVDGTPEFGLAVRNSPKPVGIFGDHQVASAGMWIASQADVIVGNKNNYTSFGSIGVLIGLQNYQNVMDAGNMPQVEIVRADQSTDKALVNSVEKISDQSRAALQAELNSIASDFIATVKEGRGAVLDTNADKLFNGKMFSANEAKKIGLIDAVGTLQTAVNKVAELARAQQKSTSVPPSGGQVNTNMKSFTKLSALLGAAWASLFHSGSEAANSSLTPEQLASLEASEKKLTDQEADIAQLKADTQAKDTKIASLSTQVSELTAQVSTLTTEKTTLQSTVDAQKAELAKKPTGTPTTVISDDKKEGKQASDQGATVEDDRAKYRTSVDQQADEIRSTKKPK